MIVSKLKQYLARLEEQEILKPESSRKHVPNLSDIHRGTGVNYNTVSRLANNKARRLDFNTAERIISYFNNLGHDMSVCDIIEFVKTS